MSTPTMSCPSGGSFYACAAGSKFVGCCLGNPCGDTGCSAGFLVPTSFEASQWGNFSDQQCDAGQFWTCADDTPPFWGCCMVNPCSSTACPTDDLAGAFLSGNPADADPYLSLNSSWVSTASLSASSLAATSTSSSPRNSATTSSSQTTSDTTLSTTASTSMHAASASAVSTTSAVPSAVIEHSSPNVGAIAGGAVGGFAVFVAFVLGLIYLLRRRRAQSPPLSVSHAIPTAGKPDPNSLVPDTYYNKSPDMASGWSQSSPRPPYSPAPPSYRGGSEVQQAPQELAGTQWELDSGQRFHPYRPERVHSAEAEA